MLLNYFLPNEQVNSVFDIHPKQLKKQGIKGIITDLDNTLIPWDETYATEEIKEWFELIRNEGIKIIVFSNNNEERVRRFAQPLNVEFLHKARKPLKRSFRIAKERLGLSNEQVVVIGDQLLTDILGGKRANLNTILVTPIKQTDSRVTQFNRFIERRILRHFKKKGLLK